MSRSSLRRLDVLSRVVTNQCQTFVELLCVKIRMGQLIDEGTSPRTRLRQSTKDRKYVHRQSLSQKETEGYFDETKNKESHVKRFFFFFQRGGQNLMTDLSLFCVLVKTGFRGTSLPDQTRNLGNSNTLLTFSHPHVIVKQTT